MATKKDGGSVNFHKSIENFLKKKAFQDPLFKPVFEKFNKNVEDAVTYIMNQVRISGRQGFTDDEIFGMAVHYYDEDGIKPGTNVTCRVVVNHAIQLKPKEIQDALKDAKVNVTKNESKKLTDKAIEAMKQELKANLSPEQIAKAKADAIAEVIQEQKDKMTKVKNPATTVANSSKLSNGTTEATLF